jgi:hypothetical protein
MASSPPWPFDDNDRPSGSVQPLSQADLQAILAHLGDDPDQLLAGPGADRPVVAVWVRASVGRPGGSAQARWRWLRAAEWAAWTRTSPGGSPPPSGSVPAPDFSVASSRLGWYWSSAGWRLWRLAGGCGSGPARRPSPGGVGRRGSGAPLGFSARWNGRGGRCCTT